MIKISNTKHTLLSSYLSTTTIYWINNIRNELFNMFFNLLYLYVSSSLWFHSPHLDPISGDNAWFFRVFLFPRLSSQSSGYLMDCHIYSQNYAFDRDKMSHDQCDKRTRFVGMEDLHNSHVTLSDSKQSAGLYCDRIYLVNSKTNKQETKKSHEYIIRIDEQK